MSRVAGPWERRDGRLVRRAVEDGDVVVVAVVAPGPAVTWSTRTALRTDERTYGYPSEEDAQRWADFELLEADWILERGPLDPPPLVERKQRGCLAASLGLVALGLGLIAAAIGVGVWL